LHREVNGTDDGQVGPQEENMFMEGLENGEPLAVNNGVINNISVSYDDSARGI
jgi:hypothetical protein